MTQYNYNMQFYLLLNIPSGTKQDFIDHHTIDTCSAAV